MNVKYNHEEFFKVAIVNLRNTSKSSGIHSVYSGFNGAFREYFKEDPIKVTQQLASDRKIEIRPVKGGVMIYLPGEAPKRADSAKTVLSKILKTPQETEKGLVDKVLTEIAPKGSRKFPEDFLAKDIETNEMFSIETPGTPLQLDANSQTTIISPRRFFKYEAKNPSEAKYIIYAGEIGQKKVQIPKDNFAVLKAVTGYEKYCREIGEQCLGLFLKYTNDEEVSELLTTEVWQKLGLKVINT
jgi:hypothetical protein